MKAQTKKQKETAALIEEIKTDIQRQKDGIAAMKALLGIVEIVD